MKKIRIGTNFTIFLLFFGLATIEAITGGRVLLILFWAIVGTFFLLMDNKGNRSGQGQNS
jgi:hypothetical protein